MPSIAISTAALLALASSGLVAAGRSSSTSAADTTTIYYGTASSPSAYYSSAQPVYTQTVTAYIRPTSYETSSGYATTSTIYIERSPSSSSSDDYYPQRRKSRKSVRYGKPTTVTVYGSASTPSSYGDYDYSTSGYDQSYDKSYGSGKDRYDSDDSDESYDSESGERYGSDSETEQYYGAKSDEKYGSSNEQDYYKKSDDYASGDNSKDEKLQKINWKAKDRFCRADLKYMRKECLRAVGPAGCKLVNVCKSADEDDSAKMMRVALPEKKQKQQYKNMEEKYNNYGVQKTAKKQCKDGSCN